LAAQQVAHEQVTEAHAFDVMLEQFPGELFSDFE
jgi:hypothetical protein